MYTRVCNISWHYTLPITSSVFFNTFYLLELNDLPFDKQCHNPIREELTNVLSKQCVISVNDHACFYNQLISSCL